jgi:hypothetical protein
VTDDQDKKTAEKRREKAQEIIARLGRMKSDRGTWESHWEEIAKRVMPSYSRTFQSNTITPGEKKTEYMFDSTAAQANVKFAAAMESMLTPRAQKWHMIKPQLGPMNRELMRDREVRQYYEDVTDILFRYRYSPRANFASNQHEIYMGLGAFGTGCLFVDKLDTGGLRYRAIHLAEIYFAENHQGIIDTAYRSFKYTARQAAQKWGRDNLPDQIKGVLEKNPEQEFEFIHAVHPNSDREYGRIDAKGMEFESCYVSVTGQQIMEESGYNTFPYAISRYVVAPGELYGRSPAMLALPDIKVLNEQKKTVLKQGHRVVDPVLLAHDDGILDSFSLKPGAVNYGGVNADGRPLVHTLPTGNLSFAQTMVQEQREAINDAFLVTLFQILVDTPQMTATEVLERAREKGALLSPTMGRQQSEALGPMIEREIDLLARQGLLPPMPPILIEAGGADYEVEYDSPLSRAQKAEGAAGTMRTIQFAAEIAAQTQDPSPLDHFNFDEIIPELGDANAMPVKFFRTEDQIAQIRKGRSEQQAVAQVTQAGPAMAAMMKATQGQGQ